MRFGYSLAGAGLILGSAVTLALQGPAGAQDAQPAQNQAITAPATAPGNAPMSFADLAAKLQPAVVNISTSQKVQVGRTGGMPQLPPGSPFEEMFRQFYGQRGDDGEPITREANSLGSGFLISPDGYVVTNNHVVTGRDGQQAVDKITVILSDRKEYQARLIGRDSLSDIALLKIDGKGLPYVRFGNSEQIRVGDWVVAIGNPFGLGGSVTAGIVSALHRNIGAGQYDRYIQTDASINMGNSGGPLFDLSGNVVGINTAIYSPTGGNIGLGFAIPAEDASKIVDQLRGLGKVRRGYLGIGIQPLSEDIAAGLGLPKDRGEIVASVEPNGPAARAGLQQGDVVLRVNNQDVTFDNTLSYIVANTPIGSSVPIEVLRDGKRVKLSAKISERPSEQLLAANDSSAPNTDKSDDTAAGVQAARASLGITLAELTPDVRRQLRLGNTINGVVIAGVNPASDAAAQGLQRGDVIVSINQQPTRTGADASAAVATARKAGRNTVLMLVQRGNNPPRYIGIKLMNGRGD